MNRLLVLTMACVCWMTGLAQHPANKLSRYHLDFTVSQTDFVDSIAILWERGQVYLPVTIGNKEYKFLFDTGSGQTVIYDDTPIPGCQSAGYIISVDAIEKRDTVRMVTLPTMTIGTTTFAGCQAIVQRRSVRRRSFDGIIGFDIIAKGLNAKIDIQAQRLILSDRKNFFDNEDGYETKYKLNFHVPQVLVNPFGRYKEWARFDTGSRHFYSINNESLDIGMEGAESVPGLQIDGRSQGRHAIGTYGAEPEGEVTFLTLDAMKWGDFLFSDVSVITTQGGSHLGAAVLNYGAVVFNPKRRRVRFEPYNHESRCSVNNDHTEIAFVSVDGRPSVGVVRPGSQPYQQGFRAGDIIIAIDGRPVTSFAQFTTWAFEKAREYNLTVRDRQGQLRTVMWIPKIRGYEGTGVRRYEKSPEPLSP